MAIGPSPQSTSTVNSVPGGATPSTTFLTVNVFDSLTAEPVPAPTATIAALAASATKHRTQRDRCIPAPSPFLPVLDLPLQDLRTVHRSPPRGTEGAGSARRHAHGHRRTMPATMEPSPS